MKQHYVLFIADENDMGTPKGEAFFTFDTPEQAKDFAETPFFRKEFQVETLHEWEEIDIANGKRFDASFVEKKDKYSDKPRQMKLIIVPIEHNPQEVQ